MLEYSVITKRVGRICFVFWGRELGVIIWHVRFVPGMTWFAAAHLMDGHFFSGVQMVVWSLHLYKNSPLIVGTRLMNMYS